MIETTLVRRAAKYKDEVGLFGVDQIADDDLKRLRLGDEVNAELRKTRDSRLVRLLWALATKLADGGIYLDKEDAMADLKIRAKHCREVKYNGMTVVVPKSILSVDGEKLERVVRRMLDAVAADLLPHMSAGAIRREVEKMIAGGKKAPSRPSRGRGEARRGRAA